jgi:hypothetical protein
VRGSLARRDAPSYPKENRPIISWLLAPSLGAIVDPSASPRVDRRRVGERPGRVDPYGRRRGGRRLDPPGEALGRGGVSRGEDGGAPGLADHGETDMDVVRGGMNEPHRERLMYEVDSVATKGAFLDPWLPSKSPRDLPRKPTKSP